MRLKGHDQRTAMVVTRGGDRGAHGGRVMRVVVNDRHSLVGKQDVEPAAYAPESFQRRSDRGERQVERAPHRQRGKGVLDVHRSGHAHLDGAEHRLAVEDVERRAEILKAHVGGPNARRRDEAAGYNPRAKLVTGK